jgi:hypothetical protein
MSLKLIKVSVVMELSDEFHLPRLLILLAEADSRTSKTVEGIMKLAKLDFLLRYPNCLERLLVNQYRIADKLISKTNRLNIKAYEKTSIESKMIRFRYGPWDSRYRRWIGILVAKGLSVTFKKGNTVHVGLTDRGREVAKLIGDMPEFADYKSRSKLIYTSVGSMAASKLKDLIYQVFPEIIDMKWGNEIQI